MGSPEEERLLLEVGLIENASRGQYTGDGSVDINGKPVLKQNTGNWRACLFILGTEFCECLSFCGIAANLVTYLTSNLHEGNASAARSVTTWSGTRSLAPLIGAVFSRFMLGKILDNCSFLHSLLHCSLYLIALGTGGIKPCVSSFGADQFDDTDPRERVKKTSFFNWFYLSTNIGGLISSTFIIWIQENVGWGLGFGIPTLFMGLSITIFFSGRPLYRFQKPGGSPFTRMCQVVVASIKKWNLEVPQDSFLLYELPDKTSTVEGGWKLEHSDELKCLDKAAVVSDLDVKQGDFNPWRLCTVTQVEELKILIRMFPICATGIVFSAVYTQMFTMFVEQGMVMDTTIGSFTIPPASLLTFDIISVIVWVPMYDRLLVPLVRKFTGKERGFSELQRIGIGLFVSILSMAAAAIVEIKRLEIAKTLDLVDHKVTVVPMSILWQIPQYFLVGAAEVFTFIGQLQLFYDQSPHAMRSLFSALQLLTIALGNYLSSFILTIVTTITTKDGNPGWIPNNLNQGHLDYYFWLLAGLGFLNLVVYVFCITGYRCKKAP